MQIKTMTRYYISIRMAKVKMLTISRASEDSEQLEISFIAGGKPKLVVTLENSLGF